MPDLGSELTRLLEDVRAGDVELSAALDRFALLPYRISGSRRPTRTASSARAAARP